MKKNITKRKILWIALLLLILMMPLAMQFTNEVQWNEVIAYSIMLLAIGGLYELFSWLHKCNKTYRIAFGIGLFGMFLLGWVSGAVGIIGSENNPANLMYWAVFGTGIIGSFISRFKPRGMAYTFFMTALVQILVPLVALFVWPARASWGEAGVIGVFIFNSIFALLFIGSALVFLRTSLINSKHLL